MLHKPQLIVFDLDGTLVDSAPDIAACIDKTMQVMGLPPRGLESVRQWMGNGVERLVKRALLNCMEGEPPVSVYVKALDAFLGFYGERTAVYSRVYPGVCEGLQSLTQQKLPLCCITNKRRRFSLTLLHALGLADFFALLIAGDDLSHCKPHPMPLLHAARHFGVKPDVAWMVGDSVNDIAAARAAGFTAVAVSYGYNHGGDIRVTNPDRVIDSLVELGTIAGIEHTPAN